MYMCESLICSGPDHPAHDSFIQQNDDFWKVENVNVKWQWLFLIFYTSKQGNYYATAGQTQQRQMVW